jgi:hypothetical protein
VHEVMPGASRPSADRDGLLACHTYRMFIRAMGAALAYAVDSEQIDGSGVLVPPPPGPSSSMASPKATSSARDGSTSSWM